MNEDPQKKWRRFEKLRNPKQLRRRLRKVETVSLRHAHTFVVSRWRNIILVRRHVFTWLGLMAVLIGGLFLQGHLSRAAYQTVAAAEGGSYSEGVMGQLGTLNPIFATSHPEKAASKLLFSGLLTYDQNGGLKNDLAESIAPSEGGKRYTVVLRDGLHWQDGAPITSDDVVFTMNTIKNLDVRSPLYASWRNIAIKQINSRTVQFDLPAVYAPFPHLLTVGIVPEHKLGETDAKDIRSSAFDRNPVGSGPFKFSGMQILSTDQSRLVIRMVANPYYHLGKVNLDRFQLYTYGDHTQLVRALKTGEVIAATDITSTDASKLSALPGFTVKNVPLNNVAMALMKTSSDSVLADRTVRAALRDATDREAIIRALGHTVRPLDSPLPDIDGYNVTDIKQPPFNFAAADQALDKAGWLRSNDGRRAKNGQTLSLTVATIKTGDYPKLLDAVTENWNKLGVAVTPLLVNPEDIQQNVLAPRAYDVLLYELAIGADPDVFPYWHSSQANARGLNLANYTSGAVDDTLVSARSRIEPQLRLAKYRAFAAKWVQDVPAIVLYQPTLHYVTRDSVRALQGNGSLVDPVDRYRDIQYWATDTAATNATP